MVYAASTTASYPLRRSRSTVCSIEDPCDIEAEPRERGVFEKHSISEDLHAKSIVREDLASLRIDVEDEPRTGFKIHSDLRRDVALTIARRTNLHRNRWCQCWFIELLVAQALCRLGGDKRYIRDKRRLVSGIGGCQVQAPLQRNIPLVARPLIK